MDLQVFVRGASDDETPELRAFAEEKLAATLDRFADHVLSATVRAEDVTGPTKHGVDKQCSVEVRLRTGEIHIKEQGEDFHATIDTAMDRLKAALSRETAKAKRGIGEG
jgi:ribosomal subunit interface protein